MNRTPGSPLRPFNDNRAPNRQSPSDDSSQSSLVSTQRPIESSAKMEDVQSSQVQGSPPLMQNYLRTCVPETFSTCNLTTCTTREVMKRLQDLPFGQRPPTPYAY